MGSAGGLQESRTGQRLSAVERRDRLSRALAVSKYVSISGMARQFNVSEMTIRRDVDALVEKGLAERAHGGAVPLVGNRALHVDMLEPALDERLRENSSAKERIGRAAARLISPMQTVAIDVGSTTFGLAQALRTADLRVFTCSLKIALLLADAAPRVYMPGGELRGTEPSLTGDMVRRQLENYRFDWAFLGASGLAEDGFYDYSLDDTEIKRTLIDASERVALLADSSKFNRLSVVRIGALADVDVLVTDTPPTDGLAERLQAAGVDVQAAAT